jgi:hypothetical protein
VIVVARATQEEARPVVVASGLLDGAVGVSGKDDVHALGQVTIGVRTVVVRVAFLVGKPLWGVMYDRHRDRCLVVVLRIGQQRHRLELRQSEPQRALVRLAVAAKPG